MEISKGTRRYGTCYQIEQEKNEKLIELYKNQMEEIDIEILELKNRIDELRKERKKIYLKRHYRENKEK